MLLLEEGVVVICLVCCEVVYYWYCTAVLFWLFFNTTTGEKLRVREKASKRPQMTLAFTGPNYQPIRRLCAHSPNKAFPLGP